MRGLLLLVAALSLAGCLPQRRTGVRRSAAKAQKRGRGPAIRGAMGAAILAGAVLGGLTVRALTQPGPTLNDALQGRVHGHDCGFIPPPPPVVGCRRRVPNLHFAGEKCTYYCIDHCTFHIAGSGRPRGTGR